MNVGFPLGDVIPGSRGLILAALFRVARPLTIRELAEASGVSHTHAGAIVADLEVAGLVSTVQRGRALLVQLNPAHLAVPYLQSLIALRTEVAAYLCQALKPWADLRAAWLFGSTARGDGDAQSDIDVLVVFVQRGQHDAQLGELARDLRVRTGNAVQFVEHDEGSWRLLVKARQPLVEAIRRDGIELVSGSRRLLEVA